MKSKRWLILIISIISFSVRFYKISKFPVHLSMDETAIAYNAYSILKTGKDEWGEKMPLAFKSAGDYKPPVNVYLSIPIIKWFGLTEFSARFVSAFLGSITPIILFLFLLELGFPVIASFLTSVWLAILPWHIHFSRAGFEAITALFFVFLGLLFFYKWLNKSKNIYLTFFIVSSSLAVWAYHAERLFVPLICLYLFFNYRKNILSNLKKTPLIFLILNLIIFLVFSVPFIKLTLFTPAITTRASVTSIIKSPELSQSLKTKYINSKDFIINNNFYKIFNFWLNQYLEYFDPRFIFWKGMEFTPKQYLDVGLVFVIDIIIFFLGCSQLITQKNKKISNLFLSLFLLGPLPASLTMNHQHPLRALTWIPAFSVIIASAYTFIQSHWSKKIFLILFIFYLINFVYFVNIYTSLFPYFHSEYWQYGQKEISQYVCKHKNKYNEIIISDTFGSDGPLNTGLPYLYILFYCQINPQDFIESRLSSTFFHIDNINFHRISWKVDSLKKNTLLIAAPWDFLDSKVPESQIVKKINFINNKEGFWFVDTNK
jgi:4-amino-4-deoxy-L-arabinose transferase-like glycosyltransferase